MMIDDIKTYTRLSITSINEDTLYVLFVLRDLNTWASHLSLLPLPALLLQ